MRLMRQVPEPRSLLPKGAAETMVARARSILEWSGTRAGAAGNRHPERRKRRQPTRRMRIWRAEGSLQSPAARRGRQRRPWQWKREKDASKDKKTKQEDERRAAGIAALRATRWGTPLTLIPLARLHLSGDPAPSDLGTLGTPVGGARSRTRYRLLTSSCSEVALCRSYSYSYGYRYISYVRAPITDTKTSHAHTHTLSLSLSLYQM